MVRNTVTIHPPEDWSDVKAWDRYLQSQARDAPPNADDILSLRFAPLVIREGGRVWIPGCGVDRGPALYAALGCSVTVSDISPFAIGWQERLAKRPPSSVTRGWKSFTETNKLVPAPGALRAIVQDFTTEQPDGVFDVVISCRAYSQLEPDAKARAARCFEMSLRPAGQLVVDTLNAPVKERNILEDSLLGAGFFIPGHEAERWYRDRLNATGIAYALVLGRPQTSSKRDQATLDSFGAEYDARLEAAVPEARKRLADGVTKIAHVIYSTG